jgi:hypothetical protein
MQTSITVHDTNQNKENAMNNNPKSGNSRKEMCMNAIAKTTFAALVTLGLTQATQAAEPPKPSGALPFTVKVTKEELKVSPPGMGGAGQDYPFCAVKIEDECWILDSHSGMGPLRAKGTNFVSVVTQPIGRNENNKHVDRPYMLGGMWYDAAEKKLYAPMHCETHMRECMGHSKDNNERQIHLSSSTDKGATWKYEGPIVTRDDPAATWRGVHDFSSGCYWDGGDGDLCLFADTRGGYVYLYSNHYTWGGDVGGHVRYRVARCAMADKMAPGKWKRFYNGKWEEPGLGGKASFVPAKYVMYNTYLKKYLSFNYGSGISFCSDMDKQDWSPSYEIQPFEAWGTTWDKSFFGLGAWHVMNEDRTDVHTGGQTLYWYKYWMGKKTECYRLDFDIAPAKEHYGYHTMGGVPFFGLGPTTFSGPTTLYGEIPFYDSSDPIESRRTRRLERGSAEVTTSPGWERDGTSGKAGSSLEFSFKAADVYWRTVRGPGMGQADVYLDGKLDATVDTWASSSTRHMFAYVKSGLDPNIPHTLKVVVRGEKNPKSTGATIAHLNFEYSAETTQARNSFSAIQGKYQWRYQERLAGKLSDMKFNKEKGKEGWVGEGGATIGPGRLATGRSEPVLSWTAHRAGTVRIEGKFWGGGSGRLGDLHVAILHNGESVWPKAQVPRTREGAFTHDLKVAVKQGDTISFEAKIPTGPLDAKGAPPANAVGWDPVLTYVEP